jgi:VacB/RNase II family 3'-5' exoribonuclease
VLPTDIMTTTPRHHRHNRMDLGDVARRAMVERGLLPEFSAAAKEQLAAITKAAVAETTVKDLRKTLWASIDNDDSRDLDQLSAAVPLEDGKIRLLVAVADVDALVHAGTPIDEHAKTNTTSVYTAAEIFPMLPERLSTDLTSLGEGVSRVALVVDMVVSKDAEIVESDVYRATVENHAKLAYNSVAAWLEGTGPAPSHLAAVPGLEENLRIQDEVAQRLRHRRFERGALSLETLEARAVFDEGRLTDLVPEGRNRAKDLIEDLMIAANGVTARFLDAHKSPSLRRVLRSPERWAKIVALAEAVGETLPESPSNVALDAFLQKRKAAAPDKFADLSLSVVKLLGRGEYVLEVPGQPVSGHFGLALRDYTHSTAPNRRFPDLLTHRLLKAAMIGKPPPYALEQLHELATHCTEQEDAATKVERRVRKSAAALLLSNRIGQTWTAFVTGASPKGTWVRIDRPAAEGRLVRGDHGLNVGDRVHVELVHTDFEHGFVDFARA